MELSTRFIGTLLGRMFTGAILPFNVTQRERNAFARFKLRGDSVLLPGHRADLRRGVSGVPGLRMARICAAAFARRSGILHAPRGGAMPVQGSRSRTRAQSGGIDRI